MVREWAAFAFGEMGKSTEQVVAALTKALSDENWRVRQNAASTLGRIRPEAKDAVPMLTETLNDTEWRVQIHAAEALANILRIGMNSHDEAHRARITSVLTEAVNDENFDVRFHAAAPLVRIGEPPQAVLPVLIEGLSHEDGWVFSQAIHALGEMGKTAKEAVPELVRIFTDKKGLLLVNIWVYLK